MVTMALIISGKLFAFCISPFTDSIRACLRQDNFVKKIVWFGSWVGCQSPICMVLDVVRPPGCVLLTDGAMSGACLTESDHVATGC